jgi:hypothetical protein
VNPGNPASRHVSDPSCAYPCEVSIHDNTNVTVNNWRPARWDYADYDPYRRPVLYNPCGEDTF